MKILYYAGLVVVALLAVASGVAKVTLLEQEIRAFGQVGFSNAMLMVFGAVQIIGALCFAFIKTRKIGGLIIAETFLVSAYALFQLGNLVFAVLTLIVTSVIVLLVTRPFHF